MAVKKVIVPDPVITLNDDYQVTIDKRCLILQRTINNDDSELSSEEKKNGRKNLGYYSTWEGIGKSLIREMSREKAKAKTKDNTKLSIENFITIVKETNKEITDMFKAIDDKIKVKIKENK